MRTRRLGRTEHRTSLAVLGAAAFWDVDRSEADRALALALDAGVNHLDVAPSYGSAETVLGPALEQVRSSVFVGCKTLAADARGVGDDLRRSLAQLRCQEFDLYQLHAVNDRADVDRRAGAFEAVLAARDAGLCRWVGVTGHGTGSPAAQLEAVRRYGLDTVMFPVFPRMWADEAYVTDAAALLSYAQQHDVGVLAIKAVAARPWPTAVRDRTTWYEPYDAASDVARGVRFALSVPGVTAFCTPGDVTLMKQSLEAAQSFEPMSAAEMEQATASVRSEPALFTRPAD